MDLFYSSVLNTKARALFHMVFRYIIRGFLNKNSFLYIKMIAFSSKFNTLPNSPRTVLNHFEIILNINKLNNVYLLIYLLSKFQYNL